MSKLLSANLLRLRRSRVFWVCLLATLIVSAVSMYGSSRNALLLIQEGYVRTLDDYFFMQVPMIGFVEAVFVSLFLSVEHGDGTIRNKIIVGHSRTAIYLAEEGVCLLACMAFAAACLLGSLAGMPALGPLQMDAGTLALFLLIVAFFTAALCALFVLTGMMCTSRAISPVLAILLFLALLMGASYIYNTLCEPEMTSGMMLTVDGLQRAELSPNPKYVGGALRRAYELIVNALPTGQAIIMTDLETEHPLLQLVCSALIFAAASGAGIFAFGRKDLK